MSASLSPTTPAELAEVVRSQPHVLAVGAHTKPRLSQVPDDVTLISTRGLRGIVEYEPDEFTFTALAGTSVQEISQALAGICALSASVSTAAEETTQASHELTKLAGELDHEIRGFRLTKDHQIALR